MGHILKYEALGGYNAIDLDNAIEIVARYGRRLTRQAVDPEVMRKLAQLGEVCLSVSRRLSKAETSREKPEEREYMANWRKAKPIRIEICLSRPELESRVIQALSDAQLLHKVELNMLPALSRSKSTPHNEPTNIRHRDYHFERQADNTLVCSTCARKLPLTPQGGVDLEQLGREILLRLW